MRVFLFDQKMLSVINRKEEITAETFLITDREAEKIQETLDNGGFFWKVDNYTVGCSGKKPSKDYKWDEEAKEWRICEECKAARIKEEAAKAWELIKEQRELARFSGVTVDHNGQQLSFATDAESRSEYDRMAALLATGRFRERDWKLADNTFIRLDKDLLIALLVSIDAKAEANFRRAEELKGEAEKSESPLEVDIKKGWH